MDRIKDYLLLEEEFVQNQERLKPRDDQNKEERSKVDDLRGSPMVNFFHSQPHSAIQLTNEDCWNVG